MRVWDVVAASARDALVDPCPRPPRRLDLSVRSTRISHPRDPGSANSPYRMLIFSASVADL